MTNVYYKFCLIDDSITCTLEMASKFYVLAVVEKGIKSQKYTTNFDQVILIISTRYENTGRPQ